MVAIEEVQGVPPIHVSTTKAADAEIVEETWETRHTSFLKRKKVNAVF